MTASLALDGVILRTVDFGEAHRMVTLLTAERGLVSAAARGARASRRRFGGALELFTLVRAQARERGPERVELASVSVLNPFAGVRGDLVRIACAAYGCELAGALAREGAACPELLDLLVAYLSRLDAAPARPADLRRMELSALEVSGLAPRLDACARCGSALPAGEPARFDPSEGGVLCPACGARALGARLVLSLRARQALLAWSGAGAAGVARSDGEEPALDRAAGTEARDAIAAFLRHHLGRELKSRRFLEDVVSGREAR